MHPVPFCLSSHCPAFRKIQPSSLSQSVQRLLSSFRDSTGACSRFPLTLRGRARAAPDHDHRAPSNTHPRQGAALVLWLAQLATTVQRSCVKARLDRRERSLHALLAGQLLGRWSTGVAHMHSWPAAQPARCSPRRSAAAAAAPPARSAQTVAARPQVRRGRRHRARRWSPARLIWRYAR